MVSYSSIQPLENEVSDHQRQAISLNIEYKMSILEELKEDTGKLQGRAQSAVDDMNKVGDEIGEVTGDMREIVDGLASGLSPQQGDALFSSVVKCPFWHLLGPKKMLVYRARLKDGPKVAWMLQARHGGVVSQSSNKILQTWGTSFSRPLYSLVEMFLLLLACSAWSCLGPS